MNAKNLLLIGFISINSFLKAADGKNSAQSELKTVTIYRSGAELFHTVSSVLKQGNNELIIEGISNQLDINSIQINCPSSVTIMSIEFSNNYLRVSETSPGIQLLHDSLEQDQREIDRINVSITTTADLIEVLKANRDIKGSQAGLSVAELIRLMDYYKSKSIELQNELSIQKEKHKRISVQISRIRNQIAEEEKKNTKIAGRIHLQLSVAIAGKADFTVSYITQNAFWVPYYDIRVDDIKSPLKVLYKAKMVQTTGIDWKRVKLALSTSLPNQWGNAPLLRSWFLSYINPVAVMERGLARNRIQSFDDVKSSLAEVVVSGYGVGAPSDGVGAPSDKDKERRPVYIVNGAIMSQEEFGKINPGSIAKTEVLADAAATATYGSRGSNGVILVTLKAGLEDYVSMTDNELNISFDIDLPYDVPTNGKEQAATLKEYSIEALYKYYSVPKLDKDAYLLAEVADWERLNLLPGEANIIFEGTYVGKSFIDPNSTADTLNLTLGRDKRVVLKREKMADYSSVRFLGNNKLQKITYELTVKNNKKDTVKLMLKDQYPLSTSKEIEVELADDGNASVNKDLGALTWKLELQPGENRKIRFAYTVKYPKDKVLNLH
jgi:TonB-dependent SusC/RagA subfamily outer membrane receptor